MTGKAFCAHCGAAMIADGGTSRTGQQHHYYICKGKKKGVCEKRREDKDSLELFVTQVVYDFLSDGSNARKAVRDTLAYYEKRTGIDSIKSIEGRIAKIKRDIDDMTTAFIEAKNALLRANIEKRMNDCQTLIEDLQSQKEQLERERGRQFTEKDVMAFVAELLKGDPADKEYQRKIIDNLVFAVYVYDDEHIKTVGYLDFGVDKSIERVRLAETNEVLKRLKISSNSNTHTPPCKSGIARCRFCMVEILTFTRFEVNTIRRREHHPLPPTTEPPKMYDEQPLLTQHRPHAF